MRKRKEILMKIEELNIDLDLLNLSMGDNWNNTTKLLRGVTKGAITKQIMLLKWVLKMEGYENKY